MLSRDTRRFYCVTYQHNQDDTISVHGWIQGKVVAFPVFLGIAHSAEEAEEAYSGSKLRSSFATAPLNETLI